jgi:UDPglucose--hexose-1-phosphate uridylyltransferase
VNAYKDRLTELSQKPYVKYVQIFRNHGLEAGASLSHAHSQIIATPFVPSIPAEEQAKAKAYHDLHGSCPFCDILKSELAGPRLVLDSEHFGVFAPYASVNPMEFWIVPKRHSANLLDLTQPEWRRLLGHLKPRSKPSKT